MTEPDFEFVPPPDDLHPALEAWLDDVPVLISGLPLRLPAGMRLDLSRESVADLNVFALARFPDDKAVMADDELTRDLVLRLSAYLGEALLHAGGGYWDYVTDPTSPIEDRLVVYPAYDAFPVVPLFMLTTACYRRSLEHFTKLYDNRVRKVAERRAADPAWRPQRVYTPGFTRVPPQPDALHDAWLADTDRALAEYVATLPPGQWDLSPASLDALEQVLLARYPDEQAWRAAPEQERDGPIRYLGEVVRRAVGGRWESRPGEQSDEDMFQGRRILIVGDDQDTYPFMPHLTIEVAMQKRTPGRIRRSSRSG